MIFVSMLTWENGLQIPLTSLAWLKCKITDVLSLYTMEKPQPFHLFTPVCLMNYTEFLAQNSSLSAVDGTNKTGAVGVGWAASPGRAD